MVVSGTFGPRNHALQKQDLVQRYTKITPNGVSCPLEVIQVITNSKQEELIKKLLALDYDIIMFVSFNSMLFVPYQWRAHQFYQGSVIPLGGVKGKG